MALPADMVYGRRIFLSGLFWGLAKIKQAERVYYENSRCFQKGQGT
jgi:hypothetical protein